MMGDLVEKVTKLEKDMKGGFHGLEKAISEASGRRQFALSEKTCAGIHVTMIPTRDPFSPSDIRREPGTGMGCGSVVRYQERFYVATAAHLVVENYREELSEGIPIVSLTLLDGNRALTVDRSVLGSRNACAIWKVNNSIALIPIVEENLTALEIRSKSGRLGEAVYCMVLVSDRRRWWLCMAGFWRHL
jgi:hypothetical protein